MSEMEDHVLEKLTVKTKYKPQAGKELVVT
jgi:hypothetical protein